MNVIPLLGIRVVRSTGKPVLSHVPDIATVSLVKSVTLPSQKGRVLKARITCPDYTGKDICCLNQIMKC